MTAVSGKVMTKVINLEPFYDDLGRGTNTTQYRSKGLSATALSRSSMCHVRFSSNHQSSRKKQFPQTLDTRCGKQHSVGDGLVECGVIGGGDEGCDVSTSTGF